MDLTWRMVLKDDWPEFTPPEYDVDTITSRFEQPLDPRYRDRILNLAGPVPSGRTEGEDPEKINCDAFYFDEPEKFNYDANAINEYLYRWERQSFVRIAISTYLLAHKYFVPLEENRFCVLPTGSSKLISMKEHSSAFSWIGVNGGNDISCVVTMSGQHPYCNQGVATPRGTVAPDSQVVLQAALADMIEDTSDSFRNGIRQEFHTGPVAVVSSVNKDLVYYATGTGSPDRTQELLALRFLEDKLKDRSTLSYKETEQIAICALKLLLGDEFDHFGIRTCAWPKFHETAFAMGRKAFTEALVSQLDANKEEEQKEMQLKPEKRVQKNHQSSKQGKREKGSKGPLSCCLLCPSEFDTIRNLQYHQRICPEFRDRQYHQFQVSSEID